MSLEMSASTLKKGDLCPRRLVFDKVDGLPDPAGPAAELGKLVHGQMESWVRSGVLPTHPLAIELLKHAPAPGQAWVEHEFHFGVESTLPDGPGVKWKGFVDFLAGYDSATSKTHLVDSDVVLVGDYKTTSNFSYALRPEKPEGPTVLVNADGKPDPQSSLYAFYAFVVMGAKRVYLRWPYVQTKGALSSRRVEVEADRARVTEVYQGMHLRAAQYVELLTIRPKANSVPYRSSGCYAYRKICPFSTHCQKPQGVFESSPLDIDQGGVTLMDFLSSIRGSFPVAASAADDEAPPPPPSDSEPPPPPPEDEEHEAIRIVQEYYISQGKEPPRNLAKPEAGFINAPEADELESAPVDPAHAVEIFGAEPVKEPKAKKTRAKKSANPVAAQAEALKEQIPAMLAEVIAAVEAEPARTVEEYPPMPTDEEIKVAQARTESLKIIYGDKAFDADERLRRIIREELRAYFAR